MEKTLINDIRTRSELKNISLSGFKKTDVKKQLLLTMFQGKVEPSCYWCAELICAGHYMDVWETVIYFLAKYIHLGNPKLAIYLEKRFEVFRNVMIQALYHDELELRNNSTIRDLFAEIICILTTSLKKPSIEPMKINKEEEFDMTLMTDKLKAPSTDYAVPIMKKEDPHELWIAINEFTFHITSNAKIPNMTLACYWVEWIIEFDVICKKRKLYCTCETRDKTPVEHKYKKEIIWLIWDALFYVVLEKKNEFLHQLLVSLFHLFCIKFTPACVRKRRYLLYFAVSAVTDSVNTDMEMIQNKPLLKVTINEINVIYKQIKKNEISPNTDYLFQGLGSENSLQKSLYKLEILNGMDFS
jgi:hypothetical protein